MPRDHEENMDRWLSGEPQKSDDEGEESEDITLEESSWNDVHGPNPFRQSFEFDRTTEDFPGTDTVTPQLRAIRDGRIVDGKGLLQMENIIRTPEEEVKMPKA